MRIEKISDTQMKFILRQTDLDERDIKINELSHGSDKTQQLFREMVRLAQDEGPTPAENAPYLIEASRIGVDCLAVVVTKIDPEEMEKRISLVPAAKERCKFKKSSFIDQTDCPSGDSHSIFSFDDLDLAAIAADAINLIFHGESELYKLGNLYFLWLINETEDDRTTSDLESILMEFGQKHISGELSKQYLAEHGEAIISKDAVSKLCQYATCS
ncbi:MAG: adaptor protein MecA [Defluviitaleaceae bacterium]|nr:adaptor protein MecA [Defluviitaleaceae bacterium]